MCKCEEEEEGRVCFVCERKGMGGYIVCKEKAVVYEEKGQVSAMCMGGVTLCVGKAGYSIICDCE